jgi:hypothetical protein
MSRLAKLSEKFCTDAEYTKEKIEGLLQTQKWISFQNLLTDTAVIIDLYNSILSFCLYFIYAINIIKLLTKQVPSTLTNITNIIKNVYQENARIIVTKM